jgi:hypothetical protein
MFNYNGKITPRSRVILPIELKYPFSKIGSAVKNVRIRRVEKFRNLFINIVFRSVIYCVKQLLRLSVNITF